MKNNIRKKILHKIFTVAASIVFLSCLSSFALADIIIVKNPNVPEKSVSKIEMEKIFTGKKSKWNDGTKIVLVVLSKEDVHEQFTRKYVSKSASQFRAYWNKMVFTGEGKPPQTFDSEDALIEYVAKTPGAVGYVTKASPKVQTLAVTE